MLAFQQIYMDVLAYVQYSFFMTSTNRTEFLKKLRLKQSALVVLLYEGRSKSVHTVLKL